MSLDAAVTGRSIAAGESRLQVLNQTRMVQHEHCGTWVIRAQGSYDIESVTPLAHALESAAKVHPKVVLDASGITFADSSLLNLLIRTHRVTDLRVAAPTQQLLRLLQLTGVDTVVKARETVEEAVAC